MRIESGATLDQRIRIGVFLIMCVGMGGYFVYDGVKGYPGKNLEWAKQSLSELSPEQRAAVQTNRRAVERELRLIQKGMSVTDIEKRLGQPSAVLPRRLRFEGEKIIATVHLDGDRKVIAQIDDAGKTVGAKTQLPNPDHDRKTDPRVTVPLVEHVKPGMPQNEVESLLGPPARVYERVLWYIGPAAYAEVQVSGGKVFADPMIAVNDERSEGDILLQKIIGVALFIAAVWVAIKFYRLVTMHVVADEAGLTFGRRVIPWNKMTALRTEAYDRKGWVDLDYDAEGAERSLRLDSYHIDKFDDIVTEICQHTGFESPLTKESEDDADEKRTDA